MNARASGRGWQLVLGVGLVGAALYVVAPHTGLTSGAYVVVNWAAALVIVLAVRHHRPHRPAAWMLLAGAVALTGLADAAWFWLDLRGLEPFPSIADVFYLSSYIVYATALWMLGRRSGRDTGALSDALIVGTSAAVLAWAFLIAPSVQDHALTMSQRLTSVAYPVGDLVLLTLILRLVFLHGARVGAHILILVGGVAYLAADVLYALGNAAGWYAAGNPIDGLWLAAYTLFAAAALHPSVTVRPPAQSQGPALTPRRLVVLAAAAVVAPAVIILRGGTDLEVVRVAAAASILLFLLIMQRLAGLMRETRRQGAVLEDLSRTDPLTGAANRRHLDHELARELSRADRTDTGLSLAYLDLDQFKRFNDTHGHPAGDALLQELVATWQGALRPVDVLARVGGEEFVVVLPGDNINECRAAVERLRGLVPHGQTCSAGIADRLPGETAAALIGRADQALYAAKDAGRDRTVLADAGGVDQPRRRPHPRSRAYTGCVDRPPISGETAPHTTGVA
jgi:diguanylate cyclase (GGDEF)-like protein